MKMSNELFNSREEMMTITVAPLIHSTESEQITVDEAITLLLEDIKDLEKQRHRRHIFQGNGAYIKQIVILPNGASLKDFKGCIVSHLQGTFAANDLILRRAMKKLHKRYNYHVQLVEYHYCCIREDMVPYHVYQVDLLEPTALS
jgi:hypothetical protein